MMLVYMKLNVTKLTTYINLLSRELIYCRKQQIMLTTTHA